MNNKFTEQKRKDRQHALNVKLNLKRSYRRLQKRAGENESDPLRSADSGRVAKGGRGRGRGRGGVAGRGRTSTGSNDISIKPRKPRFEDLPDPYAHLRRDDDEDWQAGPKIDDDESAEEAPHNIVIQESESKDRLQSVKSQKQSFQNQQKKKQESNSGADAGVGSDEEGMNSSDNEVFEDDDEDEFSKKGPKKKKKERTKREKPNPFAKAVRESNAIELEQQKSREELEAERKAREEGRSKYYAGRKREQRAYTKKTRRGQPVLSAQIDSILDKLQRDRR
ncbi:hypothetical protein HDU67_006400 [Dinochytrium kinnereticum]|nr:hypothetical protein HDU67_006400 [Dinochytrium kinnereticum]